MFDITANCIVGDPPFFPNTFSTSRVVFNLKSDIAFFASQLTSWQTDCLDGHFNFLDIRMQCFSEVHHEGLAKSGRCGELQISMS